MLLYEVYLLFCTDSYLLFRTLFYSKIYHSVHHLLFEFDYHSSIRTRYLCVCTRTLVLFDYYYFLNSILHLLFEFDCHSNSSIWTLLLFNIYMCILEREFYLIFEVSMLKYSFLQHLLCNAFFDLESKWYLVDLPFFLSQCFKSIYRSFNYLSLSLCWVTFFSTSMAAKLILSLDQL